MIYLSPREHFIAHYLLAKALGGKHWISVNLIANCNNPYQHRKMFNNVDTKILNIIRINSAKENAAITSKLRATESVETTRNRVLKWKEARSRLSVEEYKQSFVKGRQTKLKHIENGLYTNCDMCGSLIKNENFKVHQVKCTSRQIERINKRTESKQHKTHSAIIDSNIVKLLCLNVLVFEREVRFVKPDMVCVSCGKSYKYQHTCKQPKIKIIKEKLKCPKCNKTFVKLDVFNNHILKDTCLLTKEERHKLGRIQAMHTMESKTPEDKALIGRKISNSIKTHINSLSDGERKLRNEKTGCAIQAHYNSNIYDSTLRSEQVKNGLKNKKNRNN